MTTEKNITEILLALAFFVFIGLAVFAIKELKNRDKDKEELLEMQEYHSMNNRLVIEYNGNIQVTNQ